MIECEYSVRYEVINIDAQTNSLTFSINPLIPYSEAYLIIQGDNCLDEHNSDVTILAVPHGFKLN